MSTQNKTQSTNQYNQGSMGVFNQLNPAFGSAIQSEINNPYNNMAFNTQLQMMNRNNAQNQNSGLQAMQQRLQAQGIGQDSPFYASQLGKLQRQGMANQGQGFNNLLMQATQLRQNAITQAGAYRPLQTGQTQVQTQSGLGTWLPQLAGAAIGAVGMGMGGGMGAAAGGAGKGSSFFSGANAGPQGMMGAFSGVSGGNMGPGAGPDMGGSNFAPGFSGANMSDFNPFLQN